MRKRLMVLMLALMTLLPNTGCAFLYGLKCCLHRWHCAVAARTYCGDSCGEVYHCEWCADPPDCCEPCNNHGDYIGCDRNPWVGPKKGCPTCY